MTGVKRKHGDDTFGASVEEEQVHPSRRKRLDGEAADAELRQIFNLLRDEIQSTRLEATRNLLKILSIKSDKQAQDLDYAITRLVKGVCSGAKAARPGFSVALVEVLRLGFASTLKVSNVVDKVTALTTPESKASGDETRNYLIGRRCALQTILQSGVLEKVSENDAKQVFEAIAELAEQKTWSRSECGAMLCEFLKSPEGALLLDNTVRSLVDAWATKGLLKSPEGIALWLICKKTFPNAKLPKGVWHHNNPLSSQERPAVTKILLKNAVVADDQSNGAAKKGSSGARQITPSFAWQVILDYLCEQGDGQKFGAFWEECVARQMFSASSSTERKNLGLQILALALSTTPVALLGQVVHTNIVRCIVDQRANKDRYLFEAAKVPLNQMVKRAESEPAAASAILCSLLTVLPPNFDKSMKATIESLLSAAKSEQIGDIVSTVIERCRVPGLEDAAIAEKKRRVLADILLNIVRSRRSQPTQLFASEQDNSLAEWLKALLISLARLGYVTSAEDCVPPLSDDCQMLFRERLSSALGHLLDLPVHQAVAAPALVVETLHDSKKELTNDLDEKSTEALKEARKQLKDAAKKAKNTTGATMAVMRAFQLLLSLAMLQVYKQEPDSTGVLEDIISCYQMPSNDGDASTMIVELLLSFVSKPSALLRRLAEQVFSAFAPELTPDGLQSMIDILSQKESLAGQQELFKDNDEKASDEDEDAHEDADIMDMDDASDAELVNGQIINGDEDMSSTSSSASSESSTSSGDEDENEDGDEDEDEETAFDRKLAAALGTTTTTTDSASDPDGSDMDDDQMMALEPHLTTIFQERRKTTSQKQSHKAAQQTVVDFKNRVLDLLLIFAKAQHANLLALDLIHPLLVLSRTTTNALTTRKAVAVLEAFFDAAKKHKAAPPLPSDDAGFALLAAVHAEVRLGGSKVHAAVCSRASQFLARMLVGRRAGNWRRIAEMYLVLQDEWRRDGKSRIHGSVFNDWHSWSMQR